MLHSLVDYLSSEARHRRCPMLLLSSHFHELSVPPPFRSLIDPHASSSRLMNEWIALCPPSHTYELVKESDVVSFWKMDVLVPSLPGQEDPGSLVGEGADRPGRWAASEQEASLQRFKSIAESEEFQPSSLVFLYRLVPGWA